MTASGSHWNTTKTTVLPFLCLLYIRRFPSLGMRMIKRNEIARKEALSKINYENAEALFTKAGIRGSEDREELAVYNRAISGYLSPLS